MSTFFCRIGDQSTEEVTVTVEDLGEVEVVWDADTADSNVREFLRVRGIPDWDTAFLTWV